MTSNRTLIRGGQVYNHDGDVHKPAVADILIEDDKIVSVGANLTSDSVHEVIDASGHRREIPERIVRKATIKMRIDCDCAVDQAQQRVAVWRGSGDLAGRAPTISRGLVLDNYGLAHRFRQALRGRSGDKVAGATGSRGHDEMNRFGRIELLRADRRRKQIQHDAPSPRCQQM